ncbi:hypothetical protein [Agromyces badenianii]|uniref:hypothetical protein n=1 Tax=Agromyces badenianii TaxID=2080742 RepID=UPI000D59B7BE|nr:hypothetical protein [Agromyces badenianii]PWC04320.1 hypothetical protein DCE94_09225 [Agromyces badenianii]
MIAFVLIFPVLLPVAIALAWLCIRFGTRDRYVARGFYVATGAVSALCIVGALVQFLTQQDGQADPEGSIGDGMVSLYLICNGVLGLFATLVLAAMPWAGSRESDPDRDRS